MIKDNGLQRRGEFFKDLRFTIVIVYDLGEVEFLLLVYFLMKT